GMPILRAPEEHVLRDGDDRMSAGLERLEYLDRRTRIVGNVLEHVERADDVELVGVRNIADIHLEERCGGVTPLRNIEACDSYFAAIKSEIGKRLCDRMQYEAGAAADFKDVRRSVTVPVERRNDQLVASAEPEALLFQRRQQCEFFGREAACAFLRKLRRMRGITVNQLGTE